MARGFSLSFSKRSKDRSGKATLVKEDGSDAAAYGVLFEISKNDRAKLDKAEGKDKGYDRDDAFRVVRLADEKELGATTYLASANACDEGLVPYDWYRDLILAGALQHRLPATYIDKLHLINVSPDPQPQRKSRHEALNVLRCTGFHRLLERWP